MGFDMSQHSQSGNYLNAGGVPEAGIVATITGVRMETFRGQDGKADQTKPVLDMDCCKPVTLNKTNNRTLCSAFGDDSDGWLNRKVRIMVEDVDFGGRRVKGLRMYAVEENAATSHVVSSKTF